MIFYFRDRKTFRLKGLGESMDYRLVLGSIYGDYTRIIMPEVKGIVSGDFVLNDSGFLAIIDSVDKEAGAMQLNVKDISNLFARKIVFNGTQSSSSVEAYIQGLITTNYISLADTMFRLPFLTITTGSTTAEVSQPDTEGGFYTIKSYLSKVRRLYGIQVEYNIQVNTLTGTLKQVQNKKQLFLDNSNYHIEEEAYSNNTLSKITAFNSDTQTATDYYLLDDGSVTTNMNAPGRVDGIWDAITVGDNEIELERVKDKLKENTFSHKITFLSSEKDARYNFYDYVKVSLRGNIYESYIAKHIVNSDGTTEYQLGELRNTFTSKYYYQNNMEEHQ